MLCHDAFPPLLLDASPPLSPFLPIAHAAPRPLPLASPSPTHTPYTAPVPTRLSTLRAPLWSPQVTIFRAAMGRPWAR